MSLLNTVFLFVLYFSPISSLLDSADNPFVYLEKHNYTYENHSIITEDEYILLTVRLPYGKGSPNNTLGPPVIFLHCFVCTFYDFLNAGPDRSLGLEILNQGYDIWMVNTRGNTFSKQHLNMNPVQNASKFWNFSFHEAGIYDVPANIDYVRNLTKQEKVSIVCFSQGCSEFLALLATKPEYNNKISFAILLAPVAYMAHVQSPLLNFFKQSFVLTPLYHIVEMLGLYELAPHSNLVTYLAQTFCKAESPIVFICRVVFELFAGHSGQPDYSLYSVAGTNDPAGASFKQMTHYLQIANSGQFQLYDYGSEKNIIYYHHPTPPSYNLSKVTVPVSIYFGSDDYFLSPKDAATLRTNLANVVSCEMISEVKTNHLDMLWGLEIVKLVHKPAISQLNNYNNLR